MSDPYWVLWCLEQHGRVVVPFDGKEANLRGATVGTPGVFVHLETKTSAHDIHAPVTRSQSVIPLEIQGNLTSL